MTERLEWDFPPTKRYRRRPRVEIMEPEEPPRLHRVELTIKHHRRAPSHFLPIFVAIVAVFLLWRYPFGFVLLAAFIGWPAIAMFLFVAAVLAIIALNERRHGREF
jgi:hypothetical protein